MPTPSPATAPAPAPAVRLDALTGLRWWAAFVVFGYHIMVFAPLPHSAKTLLSHGHFGVTFFFVLSGFVLTWSMRPGTTAPTFYWRRFARIYPLHLLALIPAVFVFTSFEPDPSQWWVKPFSVATLALSVVLLQGWSRDPAILFSGNPAAWTLTVEAFFYALHPLLTRPLNRISKRGALVASGVVVLASIVSRVVIQLDPDGWWAQTPWPVLRVNEFILGITLAWAFRQGWRPRLPLAIPVALAAGYFAGLLGPLAGPATASVTVVVAPYASEIATLACAGMIVSCVKANLDGRSRLLTKRPIVALGEWSFAFYLFHATIIYTFYSIFGHQGTGWGNLGWFALLLALSIAVAAAAHLWVEKPVEAKLRAWQANRSARRAALLA